MVGYSTTQVQTQTQLGWGVEVLDAYEKYRYNGAIKVVPPYKWYSVVHELLNKPMHFWGMPLYVQKRFFETDKYLKVMAPREWTQYCDVEVLTAPMFNDFDIIVKDVGGEDTDFIKIIWRNNADKWVAQEVVNEYAVLSNPPSGVIVGSFIGGDLPPLWSTAYKRLYILRVNSRGHDISLDRAVTDYTCNLFAGLTP